MSVKTRTVNKTLRTKLNEIEGLKNKLAQTRDELRDTITELVDIIGSLDRADGAFREGVQLLQEGLDDASEYL